MKSHLRTGLIQKESFVDTETGEILEENTKMYTYLASSKEEFLLIYSSVLGIFQGLEQSEIRVYGYLLQYAQGLEFDISRKVRISIGKQTNLNERTVYNTCRSLELKKLIFKDSKSGLYKINPRYAFKGSTHDRNTALKAILELECPDC